MALGAEGLLGGEVLSHGGPALETLCGGLGPLIDDRYSPRLKAGVQPQPLGQF